jgi:hypothetical protein
MTYVWFELVGYTILALVEFLAFGDMSKGMVEEAFWQF